MFLLSPCRIRESVTWVPTAIRIKSEVLTTAPQAWCGLAGDPLPVGPPQPLALPQRVCFAYLEAGSFSLLQPLLECHLPPQPALTGGPTLPWKVPFHPIFFSSQRSDWSRCTVIVCLCLHFHAHFTGTGTCPSSTRYSHD